MPEEESFRKKKKKGIKISEAGVMGREIFQDIVNGLKHLKPVGGRIYVEINLSVEDDHIFSDDEVRSSKLIVEVELDKIGEDDGRGNQD